jgi:hypothetical protein
MAIQSFSVGQVLTAAQVNALQANDYNQTVSNKTASYTLVATDKGTRIAMSSTSATTITVNTGLFSAGDTLFIQNLNSGVCTITAGTATVTTSASLALAQWEGGTLYFTSASAAIFFKSDGAAPSSGALTLLSATSFSASSAHNVNDVFSATYDNYLIQIATTAMSQNLYIAMRLRVGGSDNSSSNYGFSAMANGSGNSAYDGQSSAGLITSWYLLNGDGANHVNGYIEVLLRSPYLTQRTGMNHRVSANSGTGSYQHHGGGMLSVNTSYTGFSLITTAGNATGNVKVYGYGNS